MGDDIIITVKEPKTINDLLAPPDPVIELIAKFLENLIRNDEEEGKRFPTLKRLPKDTDTWIGWVSSAKDLLRQLQIEVKDK